MDSRAWLAVAKCRHVNYPSFTSQISPRGFAQVKIPFCKFHGFGNDYIIVERRVLPPDVPQTDLGLEICERHTGVGGDGLAIIEPDESGEGDFKCEIINPDGSIAGFSGNGTRCAAAYIFFKKLWPVPRVRINTRSGVKNIRMLEEITPGHYRFESEIGIPRFSSAEIPILTDVPMDRVIDYRVVAYGKPFEISAVNVGNPVACVFVDEFAPAWRAYGRALEVHPVFPERANIVFIKVHDPDNIELKIWERGAGETASSGTCVSAAAVICSVTGKTGRNVLVETEGGTTKFIWRDNGEMVLVGRADLVFCGEY